MRPCPAAPTRHLAISVRSANRAPEGSCVKRILVVDDDPVARELLSEVLQEQYSVVVACNGAEALDSMRERLPDTIVLDMMMPKGNGLQVVRALRSREVWTPVLMLTAIDQDERLVHALDAGADEYLTKPFSFVVLLARLRALVRRGAPERPGDPDRRRPDPRPRVADGASR
jgi:two-component system OmpR family response regulator